MDLKSHEEIMKALYKAYHTALDNKTITKVGFAEHIGVISTNLNRLMEKGDLSLSRFLKACEILKIDIVKLLTGSEIKETNSELMEEQKKRLEVQEDLILFLKGKQPIKENA